MHSIYRKITRSYWNVVSPAETAIRPNCQRWLIPVTTGNCRAQKNRYPLSAVWQVLWPNDPRCRENSLSIPISSSAMENDIITKVKKRLATGITWVPRTTSLPIAGWCTKPTQKQSAQLFSRAIHIAMLIRVVLPSN